jgi:hypothetical protein
MQAAGAAVSKDQISASERTAALNVVLASPLLRRSLRLRRFLSYVVETSIQNDSVSLTEQQIGVALFDRRPSYDTSVDNIVRVNATELRKRLELFYAGDGVAETVMIEIPRGSYHPVFQRRSREDAVSAPDSTDLTPAVSPVAFAESFFEAPIALRSSIVEVVDRPRRGMQYVTPLLILLLLISTASALYEFTYSRTLERQLEPWQAQPAVRSFWQNFFNGRTNTTVVLADTFFAMAQDLSGYRLTLDDYLRLRYSRPSDQVSSAGWEGGAADPVFSMLSSRNSGSIGDFMTAQRIMDLRPKTGMLRIRSARDYSGEALRHDSSILIGSMRSNPWVEPFQDKLFYRMNPPQSGQGIVVQLSNPQAGEKAVYSTSSDPNRRDGFCIIAFIPNLSGDGKTLIIAGTDSQATEAGGDFITQEQFLAPLQKRMKTSGFPSFQLLLRTTRIVGTPLKTEIVSFRLGEVT